MIDLRRIKHFESVYRLGSFSKAADELNLTHSALTKSIKALELDWDVRLFHRTTRVVEPTEAGKRLHAMASDFLSFADSVKAETIGGERELKIICGPAVLETHIHPAVLEFSKTYPHTRIIAETLPPRLAVEELIQRRAHLLLYHTNTMAGMPHYKRLQTTQIQNEPYRVVFRPGHPVGQGDFSLDAILAYKWAIAGYDELFKTNLPTSIREALNEAGFPNYRILSQSACLDMVEASDILTSAPATAIRSRENAGTIASAQHPLDLSFSLSGATLIETGAEPTVQAFIAALKLLSGSQSTH
jgi:DNA-binding transcriptional LysR family regulator